MRVIVVFAALVLAACAAGGAPNVDTGPSPFPVARGTATPPPPPNAAGQTAPPEGIGAGGLDFGAWRAADPVTYAPAFQSRVRAAATGSPAQLRTYLAGNGFACQDASGRLDCRIEIMERQCAVDWYVVWESGRNEPSAGFDRMCLGAG